MIALRHYSSEGRFLPRRCFKVTQVELTFRVLLRVSISAQKSTNSATTLNIEDGSLKGKVFRRGTVTLVVQPQLGLLDPASFSSWDDVPRLATMTMALKVSVIRIVVAHPSRLKLLYLTILHMLFR